MKLNEKIIYCRKKAGMSQVDLADALGISRQSVSKWETGESNPDITRLADLARVFEVSTDWLLSEAEETVRETVSAEKTEIREYPEWIDNLPGFLRSMARRFGWLAGLYTALSGVGFIVMGSMLNSSLSSMGMELPNVIDGIHLDDPGFLVDPAMQSSYDAMKTVSALLIFAGIGIVFFGFALASSLKQWGKGGDQ
ncbi:MAG: helix-turn-helix transcriptional regulator [Erysipelotrichaceae bacterium]|nr:helix-turn-helix transcriptional regulator [Erysipelotrichaceae bacterium]